MKLSKITIALALIGTFYSCKKGKDDPALTLRGRDARITGTWKLKSMEASKTLSGDIYTTNNINSDKYTGTYTGNTGSISQYYWTSRSFDNDVITLTNEWTSTGKNESKIYNSGINSWEDDLWESSQNQKETLSENYSLEISIYKDNTYKVVETNSGLSYSASYTYSDQDTTFTTDSSRNVINGWESYPSTNYSNSNTYEGVWIWEEGTNKSKIMINAGPITGHLVRLSNKEIILESVSDRNSTDDSENTYIDNYLYTYSTIDPFEERSGIVSQNTKETSVTSTSTSVWEKIDKESKREDLNL